jgi:hypothetical protein
MIDPFNWFWLADDNRVYGSAKQIITTDTDPDYVAWVGAGGVATIWPRDDAGNQTNAALQDVLAPYNLFVDLIYYAADARYRRASGGVTVTSLAAGKVFMTDVVSRNTINSAYDFATANPTQTFAWKLADGSFVTLNTAGVTTLHTNVATFVQACFASESNTVDGVNGGTITTRQQVDDAFAAISNVFP